MFESRSFRLISFDQKGEILCRLRKDIERIIESPGAAWGPKYLAVIVETADGDRVIRAYGTLSGWDPDGGSPHDFFTFAQAKLRTTQATGFGSREACDKAPFQIPVGGCLWGGAVTAPGIWVAASGLSEKADEEAANLVLDAFLQAACEEIARRRATDDASEMVLSRK